MIIEITGKLSELNSMLTELTMLTKDEYYNSAEILDLMAKIETRIMDFSLLFKRSEAIKKMYDELSNKYIKEILPVVNKLIQGE